MFAIAAAIDLAIRQRWRTLAGLGLVAGVPYALFQGWLWMTFGQVGLGSGGALSTPFEFIPYMGLWRVWSLLINSAAFLPLPFSTFSEVWGMLRFLCGLLLAGLLYAGQEGWLTSGEPNDRLPGVLD